MINIEKCKEIIKNSNVIFLPFKGTDEEMELSSDKKVFNKYELRHRYPGNTYITREFEFDGGCSGYMLVSKHYLRESDKRLFKAKTYVLVHLGEYMITRLQGQLAKYLI